MAATLRGMGETQSLSRLTAQHLGQSNTYATSPRAGKLRAVIDPAGTTAAWPHDRDALLSAKRLSLPTARGARCFPDAEQLGKAQAAAV